MFGSPTEIPARPLSVDEVAEKALAMARDSVYYSNAEIRNVMEDRTSNPEGWDNFPPEAQVALLNHCVTVVRRTNQRMMIDVDTTR